MDKYIQIFKRVIRDSGYKGRLLVEEFKRGRQKDQEKVNGGRMSFKSSINGMREQKERKRRIKN